MTTITLTFNPLTPVPDADTDVLASVLRDDGSIEVWEAHFEHGTWWSSNATMITSPVVSWAHKPAGVDLRKGLALAAPAPAVPGDDEARRLIDTLRNDARGGRAATVHDLDAAANLIEAALTAYPTPAQAPAVPSDEREAFICWLATTYPKVYSPSDAAQYWDNRHVSALAWQRRAALTAAPAPVQAPAVPSEMLLVSADLIRRAQHAINWHLEPDSPDEHEATMRELAGLLTAAHQPAKEQR